MTRMMFGFWGAAFSPVTRNMKTMKSFAVTVFLMVTTFIKVTGCLLSNVNKQRI